MGSASTAQAQTHTHICPACCPSTDLSCCLLTPVALFCIFLKFLLLFFVASCLITKTAGNSFLPGNWNQNKRWASPQIAAACLKGWELWVRGSRLTAAPVLASLSPCLLQTAWYACWPWEGRGSLEQKCALSPSHLHWLVVLARPTDLNKWNGLQARSCYVIHDFCFHCFLLKFCSELCLEAEPDGRIIVDILGLTLHVLSAFLSSVIHYTTLCTLQFFPLKSSMRFTQVNVAGVSLLWWTR